jgi:hypothetical protein
MGRRVECLRRSSAWVLGSSFSEVTCTHDRDARVFFLLQINSRADRELASKRFLEDNDAHSEVCLLVKTIPHKFNALSAVIS